MGSDGLRTARNVDAEARRGEARELGEERRTEGRKRWAWGKGTGWDGMRCDAMRWGDANGSGRREDDRKWEWEQSNNMEWRTAGGKVPAKGGQVR